MGYIQYIYIHINTLTKTVLTTMNAGSGYQTQRWCQLSCMKTCSLLFPSRFHTEILTCWVHWMKSCQSVRIYTLSNSCAYLYQISWWNIQYFGGSTGRPTNSLSWLSPQPVWLKVYSTFFILLPTEGYLGENCSTTAISWQKENHVVWSREDFVIRLFQLFQFRLLHHFKFT